MPAPHRTPPDINGSRLFVVFDPNGATFSTLVPDESGEVWTTATIGVDQPAYSALMAALAAHLTMDARRALTRDLAAQDGDVVVDRRDLSLVLTTAEEHGLVGHPNYRLRAAVEAARPTPTPEETR